MFHKLKNYINYLGILNYEINYKEEGAIPLFYPSNSNKKIKLILERQAV